MSGPTCVLLHLQRVIREDAFVNVAVTGATMKAEPEPDGTYRMDFGALVREAIRLSANAAVEWKTEGTVIDVHPTQCPLPDGRRVFDVHDKEH
jgi:hypothetical protein